MSWIQVSREGGARVELVVVLNLCVICITMKTEAMMSKKMTERSMSIIKSFDPRTKP